MMTLLENRNGAAGPEPAPAKRSLAGMTKPELMAALAAAGVRAGLDALYTLARPEIAAEQISEDGTRKWLLRLERQAPGERAPEIETVYIPEPDRGTLCISSQVGCTLTCSFCHTGTQRLVRNLTPA